MAAKTPNSAAKAAGTPQINPPEPKLNPKEMNLHQKFVELRKACTKLIKKKHSDGVKYSFSKIDDVYALLRPVMNEWGVDWDILDEQATRHDTNGDGIFYTTYTQNTQKGPRTIWLYEADLTILWVNVDNPEDQQTVTLHALGTNDGGPDKAKGSAWTYCLKYYLFEKFNFDQGEEDPDNKDLSDEEGAQTHKAPQGGTVPKPLTDAQLNRLYKKAEACGMTKEQANARIKERYKHNNPAALTRTEYDEICRTLDEAAKKKKEEN